LSNGGYLLYKRKLSEVWLVDDMLREVREMRRAFIHGTSFCSLSIVAVIKTEYGT
jgi:hypothetical protein